MFPSASGPVSTTPQSHLLGGTAGIIATAIVAIVALGLLIIPVFWASKQRTAGRPGEASGTAARGSAQERGPTLLGRAGAAQQYQPGAPAPRLDAQHEDLVTHGPGHPHGKPTSWVMVAVMLAAFLAGGLSLITHLWWLLWTCVGVLVVAGIAALSAGIMDDTVRYGSNPAAAPGPHRELGADAVRAHGPYPGVKGETAT